MPNATTTSRETQVRRFDVGETAHCPADRGQAAYTGTVESIGDAVSFNIYGAAFVWARIRHPDGNCAVWPTNRLTGGRMEAIQD